ncbi:unnamed protein product [Arabis nemorensis]|uniref:Uncharacterized protein n=1 Tax=Arabis nemorensis TaxID=586526 RepID=A0A565BCV1_9BRAS|nr:unnamed protein product [Arabis nemorensis]
MPQWQFSFKKCHKLDLKRRKYPWPDGSDYPCASRRRLTVFELNRLSLRKESTNLYAKVVAMKKPQLIGVSECLGTAFLEYAEGCLPGLQKMSSSKKETKSQKRKRTTEDTNRVDQTLLPQRLYATDRYPPYGRINSYSKPEYLLDLVEALEGTDEYCWGRISPAQR